LSATTPPPRLGGVVAGPKRPPARLALCQSGLRPEPPKGVGKDTSARRARRGPSRGNPTPPGWPSSGAPGGGPGSSAAAGHSAGAHGSWRSFRRTGMPPEGTPRSCSTGARPSRGHGNPRDGSTVMPRQSREMPRQSRVMPLQAREWGCPLGADTLIPDGGLEGGCPGVSQVEVSGAVPS